MKHRARPVERRYHINSVGVVYIFVMVLLGIGAINSQNNLLFILFGMALGAMTVSGLVSGVMMMGLGVSRRRPQWAQVGKPLRLDYEIQTRSRIMPAYAIEIQERASHSAGRVTIERGQVRTFVTHVPKRSTARAQATYVPMQRGILRLERVRLLSSFPFGLMRKSVSFIDEAEVLVWPELIEPPGGVRRALGRQGRSPEESRNRRGHGQEFFGLRGYAVGDSPRSVAWKASARSDTLLTRQNTDPVSTRLIVQLYLAPVSGNCTRELIERTISTAAGIVSMAQREGLVVALEVPQAGVSVQFGKSGRHVARMLDALAALDLSTFDYAKTDGQAHARAAVLQLQPRMSSAPLVPGAIVVTCDGSTAGMPAKAGAPAGVVG